MSGRWNILGIYLLSFLAKQNIFVWHSEWSNVRAQNDSLNYNLQSSSKSNNSKKTNCARYTRLYARINDIERMKSKSMLQSHGCERHLYAHTSSEHTPKRQWMKCEGLHSDRLFTFDDILPAPLSPLLDMEQAYASITNNGDTYRITYTSSISCSYIVHVSQCRYLSATLKSAGKKPWKLWPRSWLKRTNKLPSSLFHIERGEKKKPVDGARERKWNKFSARKEIKTNSGRLQYRLAHFSQHRR